MIGLKALTMARTKKKDVKPAKVDKSVAAAKAPKKTDSAKKPAEEKKKKKKKRNYESYNIYLFKVLRQIHESMGISRKTMMILNDFMNDIFERIANEASSLARKNKSKTISIRDIMTAVQLQIKGQLASHAMAEGKKAVLNYENSFRVVANVQANVQADDESNDETNTESDDD